MEKYNVLVINILANNGLPDFTITRQMPERDNKRKSNKTGKDQPYKNGVKKNDEKKSDVSTFLG